MDAVQMFPFAEYWWFYALFTVFIVALLAIDLGVFHRNAHTVSPSEAAVWSAIWIALGGAFNVVLYTYARWSFAADERLLAIPGFEPSAAAWRIALEFLAGYVVEKSLSVDNIFVFVIVFSYFSVPPQYHHRVLFYGIVGAMLFRAMFIALGSVLMQYHWVVILFGGFLIVTGLKLFFSATDTVEPERNPLIRLVRRFLPVTERVYGHSFLVRLGGRWHATPLLLAVVFLEATDVIFAIDSVPAIFALTREPLVVFTSNVFAILGLRALYFLLAGAIDRFHMLKYGLAVILIFVGLKMLWLNDLFEGKFPIGISLGIIAGVLAAAVAGSILWPRRPAARGGSGRTPTAAA